MPQLIVQDDPYANINSQAASDAIGGFMPNVKAQAEAQTLAAQIRRANIEQQKLQQDMEFARNEERRKSVEEGRKNTMWTHQQTAGVDAGHVRQLELGPRPVDPMQAALWDARRKAALSGAGYVYDGGGDMASRAQGDARYTGAGMIQNPAATPRQMQTGQTLFTGHAPGANAADVKAQMLAQGKIDTANGTLDKLQHAEDAYRGLMDKGEIGRWAGGTLGQIWDGYAPEVLGGNREAAGLRDAYTAAANNLQLELSKINFSGQGAVTDNERRILQQTLPMLNNADPQRSVQILQQMRETAQNIIARQQQLLGSVDAAPEQEAINPQTGHVVVLRNGQWVDK